MSCPTPFLSASSFPDTGGFIDGRICEVVGSTTCCLPCPMTDWTYSNVFQVVGIAAEWVSVASTVCCLFLLLSWTVLPIDKTHRHYLSICLTLSVVLMNLGFIIPLAGRPNQCYNSITPNDMQTSSVCAASGTFIILGGWAAVCWVFLRSLSLHLQICWQVVVGRNFLWFSQLVGWGLPVIGIILALTLSGVSFRFGNTCHINHSNSLADMWIPLLVFAGLTLIIQFSTFGYCIKVYLASLADNNATTENSAGLPSYTNSIRTMTPRQAYRRVRRVLQLQWRGIAIVLIIIADVIFFAIVFVFQDNTVQAIKTDPTVATPWIQCLVLSEGDKDACLGEASGFVVNIATIGSVLILLAMNGFWLLVLLGRWSMVTGWIELLTRRPIAKREFVSVDALGGPYDLKMNTDPRSYEMLSRDKDELVTPDMSTVREGPIYPPLRSYLANTPPTPDTPATNMDKSPTDILSNHAGAGASPIGNGYGNGNGSGNGNGRRTPDYFGGAARYQPPTRSFSSPRPPTRDGGAAGWDAPPTSHPMLSRSPPSSSPPAGSPYSPPGRPYSPPGRPYSPSGSIPARPYSPPTTHHYSQNSYGSTQDSMNPLQMNRI